MKLSRRTFLATAGVKAAGTDAVSPAPSAGASPRRLVVPLAVEPDGLIPGLSEQPACRLIGTKLYQGLVRFSPSLQPQPDLATAWTVSPDGLTYAFALRQDVTWHDGAPFTGEDVVFSLGHFHRLLSPRMASTLERISSIQADGQDGVELALSTPLPLLLSALDALSTPIVPRHIHDRPGFGMASGQDVRSFQPIGTGPFRFASWLRLVPFESFGGRAPNLDEIVFPVLPDAAARLSAAQAGQPVLLAADALAFAAVPRLRQQGFLVEGQTVPQHPQLARLDLNRRTVTLADPRVRLALASAVDRETLLRDVWANFGAVATGPLPAVLQQGETSMPLPAYDPRAAAGRLDAAGLHPDEQGIRLRLGHMVLMAEPWPQLAAALQAMFALVGVELMPEQVGRPDWTRRMATQAYETTGVATEYSAVDQLDLASRKRMVDEATQIWLVEPAIPVAADRHLRVAGGIYSNFADAGLMG